MDLLFVATEQLAPNPWNPNQMDPEMYRKAVTSIQKFGFVDPITVRALVNADTDYQIIDGENRWLAAADLHLAKVPIINLGIVEDHIAQQLTIVLNETRGTPDPGKLGELLRTLSIKLPRGELLDVLPLSPHAFAGLTGLPTLNQDQRPQLPAQKPMPWVERVFRMPNDAAMVVDQALARAKEEAPDMPDWQALEVLAAEYLGS